jgi:tetratricopeptide (TPR) repeat protein
VVRRGAAAPTTRCVGAPAGADVAAFTSSGNDHFKDERYSEARTCYEWALSQDPSFQTALLNVGLIALVEQDFAEAQRRIEQVVTLDPRYAYGHFSLGNVHASKQPRPDHRGALAAYEAAYALEPTLRDLGAALTHAVRSRAQEMVERGQQAGGGGGGGDDGAVGGVGGAVEVLRRHVGRGLGGSGGDGAQYGSVVEQLVTVLRDHGQPEQALRAASDGLSEQPRNPRLMLAGASAAAQPLFLSVRVVCWSRWLEADVSPSTERCGVYSEPIRGSADSPSLSLRACRPAAAAAMTYRTMGQLEQALSVLARVS